jgi:putative ABC transport system permease protein
LPATCFLGLAQRLRVQPGIDGHIVRDVPRVCSDFRFALRSLRRNPSFAVVAALSIALGIGANTAMFSLADAMLLRPVPVPDPAAC